MPGQNVQLIKVATLRELPVTDSQCEEFRQSCIETAGCYKTPEQAEAELFGLEAKLLSEARPTIVVNTGKSAKRSPSRSSQSRRASGTGPVQRPDPVQKTFNNAVVCDPADCASLTSEPIHAGPSKGERMARREFQMPAVLRQKGPRPYWYIRYRRKVLVGKDQIERKEVWHTLGIATHHEAAGPADA